MQSGTSGLEAAAESPPPGERIRIDPERKTSDVQALDSVLRTLVAGQDEAVEAIIARYQTYMAGLAPRGRPAGSFLFLGPSGCGKTRLVESFAEALGGSPNAIIRIDCAEFSHSHDTARLTGPAPVYLGRRGTPLFSPDNLAQKAISEAGLNVVLFENLEAANDAIWSMASTILKNASITLWDDRRVDFSRSMIFMTSRAGAREISALARPRMGFPASPPGAASRQRAIQACIDTARRKLTPGFLDLIDNVVVFSPLGSDELGRVLEIQLQDVQRRILSDCGVAFGLTVEETAKRIILTRGTDIRYGARHLIRTVEAMLIQPLSNLLRTAQVEPGDWVHVEADPSSGRLQFLKEAQRIPPGAIVDLCRNEPPERITTGRARAAGRHTESPAAGEVMFGE